MSKKDILDNYLTRYKLVDQCPYKIEIRKIDGKEYIWLMAVDLSYLILRSTEEGSITLNIPSIIEGIDCRNVFRLYRDTMTFYLKDRIRGIDLEEFTESIHKLRIIGNDNKLVATNGLLSLDIDEIRVADSMESDPHYEGYLDTLDDFDLEMEDEENMYCFDLKEIILENFDASNMCKISCLDDTDVKMRFINCKIGNLCRAREFYNLINNSDGFDFLKLDYSNLELTYSMFYQSDITNKQLQMFNLGDSSKILNAKCMFDGCKKLKNIPDLDLLKALNLNFMYSSLSVGGNLVLGRNACKPGTALYRGLTSVASSCLEKYESTLLENVIVDGYDIIIASRNLSYSDYQGDIHTLVKLFNGCKKLKTVLLKNITYNFGSITFENGAQISEDDIKTGKMIPLSDVKITTFSDSKQLDILDKAVLAPGKNNVPYVNLTRMFAGCTDLQTLVIENVYMPYLGIGFCKLFENCKKLKKIVIKNVLFLGTCLGMSNLFLECKSLEDVELINVVLLCNMNVEEAFRREFEAAKINPKLLVYKSKELDFSQWDMAELEQSPIKFYNKMLLIR